VSVLDRVQARIDADKYHVQRRRQQVGQCLKRVLVTPDKVLAEFERLINQKRNDDFGQWSQMIIFEATEAISPDKLKAFRLGPDYHYAQEDVSLLPYEEEL
jgi:hypothetical protein